MDKVNIGESSLKDFGDAINEAADILNKGKVAFENSIPDKTLQVLPYTGQAGALIPSKIGDLDDLTTTAKDNLVNAINEVNDNLSSNTNVVTLDTDQTITGYKIFDRDIAVNSKIYFGNGVISGSLTESNGLTLSTDRDSDGNNNIAISPGGNGGLSLITSGNQGISINDNGSGGVSIFSIGAPNSGFITIYGGNNISITTESNMTMTTEGSLTINIDGGLALNDRAKSEFQRVLEIPSTSSLIDQSTNQSINSTKTFTVPPVSTVTPSNANHITNKAYVDSVGNSKVALSGNQSIAGNKTFSGATTTAALTANGAVTAKSTLAVTGNTTIAGTLTANGAIALNGSATFKLIPNCAVKPTGNNHLANKLYVDNLGGVVSSGAAIDFRKGNHFVVNLSANAQISVANWGGVAGKTGTITVLNANRITGFKAPFNFRTAQSGFTGTEVFSYYCYSSGLIRIVRS